LGKELLKRGLNNKARNMPSKDAAITASSVRLKKKRKGYSTPEELRTPAVRIQPPMSAKLETNNTG
jgi:hypothetical protein